MKRGLVCVLNSNDINHTNCLDYIWDDEVICSIKDPEWFFELTS